MRRLMAANWKMYKTSEEAAATIEHLSKLLGGSAPAGSEILVFAPFTALEAAAAAMRSLQGGYIGAQNMYPAENGAFTGEISPDMIRAAGASWVLVGHSERRHLLGENDEFIGNKLRFALEKGLDVMLCVGETLQERENGEVSAVLERQLSRALTEVPETAIAHLAVAYEPVWAIGTGRSAGPEDILKAHTLAANLLEKHFGRVREVPLLYGGSVKPENAATILALDNVDGVLVGGASLQAESFTKIVTA